MLNEILKALWWWF